MDKRAIIFGKKIVSRKETLEYVANKYIWQNAVIGISAFFGFWAWIVGRILGRKVIYYCIDFYSPKIAINGLDEIFIHAAMLLDKFLCRHCDKVWDISSKINEGRFEFANHIANSLIVPLTYPRTYFRFKENVDKHSLAFVGLVPYGKELWGNLNGYKIKQFGIDGLMPLQDLLEQLSECGIGIAIWKERGNNYYGDPGKTKLYSACGLPVITTDNNYWAKIVKNTDSGIVIDYGKTSLKNAIYKILSNYPYYKNNVKKTWKYIEADRLFDNFNILD